MYETDLNAYIVLDKPKSIGYLYHEATNSTIPVYHKINIFKRLMLKLCFGIKYIKNN